MNQEFFQMVQSFLNDPKNNDMIQSGLQAMQDRHKDVQATGSAGGDMVTVQMNGSFEVTKLQIDPLVVDNRDVGMLEQLILNALADAQEKIKAQIGSNLGNIPFPGQTPPAS